MKTHFSGLTDLHKIVNAKSWLWPGFIIGICLAIPTVSRAALSFVGNGYVILDANGAGDYNYNVDNASDSSTPKFSGNLGTLIKLGQSLYIGGNDQTYPNEYGTSSWMGYNLLNSSGTIVSSSGGINLPYNGSAPYPNGNNANWVQEASTSGINLGNSVAVGTYTLDVWFGAYNSDAGNIYDNNNGNNYSATFIVAVPEPIKLALTIFGGLMLTAGLARRFVLQRANGR
jgi:hypothetical protein